MDSRKSKNKREETECTSRNTSSFITPDIRGYFLSAKHLRITRICAIVNSGEYSTTMEVGYVKYSNKHVGRKAS